MSKVRRNVLIVLCALTLTNQIAWAISIPFAGFPYGAPDEIHHFEVARFVGETGRMPVFGAGRDLYIRVRPGAEDTIPNRIYGWNAVFPPGAYVMAGLVIQTLPELEPSQEVLAARTVSIACMVALVLICFQIASRLSGGDEFVSWGVAVLVATIPQVAYVGSYHNPDALAMVATAATLLLGLDFLEPGQVPWTRALLLGLTLSLAVLSKLNAWLVCVVYLLVVLAVWLARVRRHCWVRLALIVVPPAVTLASWFLFQQSNYGDPFATEVFESAWSADRPFLVPLSQQGYNLVSFLLQTEWLSLTFRSFWGLFGYMFVQFEPLVYWILFLACLVSSLGLASGVLRRIRDSGIRYLLDRKRQPLVFVLLVAVVVTVSAQHSLDRDFQAQGRYLFPVLVPICTMLVLGWRELLPTQRLKRIGLGLLITCMVALNIAALLFYVIPGTAAPVQEEWFYF